MPIDSINAAMTPLQFASARSAARTVETNSALSSRSGASARPFAIPHSPASAETSPAHHTLPPLTFHWSYRLVRINGKSAAKRTPQFSDTSFWSVALNRLG